MKLREESSLPEDGIDDATDLGLPVRSEGVDWVLAGRRAGAAAALAGVAFLGGLVGDMLPTPVELGPHDATVQITTANRVTADLGPIGTISAKSPIHAGPITLGGIKITVREIPDGDGTPMGKNEIQQYEQFFSEPGRKTIESAIEDALLRRALESGAIALGGVLLAGWLLRANGRAAVLEAFRSRRMMAVAGATMASLMLAGSVHDSSSQAPPENAVLASVGVHGVTVTGKPLETAVNTYGPQVINYLHALDAYYGALGHDLLTAYDLRRAQEKEDPTNEVVSKMNEGTTDSVLWISDNHCNTETAAIAADAAKRIHAIFVMDTGDQTMGGTPAERLCVAVLPQRLDNKIPIVVALGNHDNHDVTASLDRDLGYTVLEGKVVTVKGYSILGDSDVMSNTFGVDYHQDGPESQADISARLAATAQHAGGVDLLMIHEPRQASATVEGGWAAFAASGHTHVESGPDITTSPDGERYTIRMINGTTAGAAPNKMTFESRLGKDSTMIELVFDKKSKEPLGYRNLIMHPNGTVEVSDVVPFKKPDLKSKRNIEPSKSPSPGTSLFGGTKTAR